VKSNRVEWQLTGVVREGQDESDLMSDWETWKETLAADDRGIVEALVLLRRSIWTVKASLAQLAG
jgi:hypothetical protein